MLKFDDMTNEHNFKKGDRVRYTGERRCYVETDIDPSETYTVKDVIGDEVVIDVPSDGVIWEKDLELVESCDRKTDFSRRLRSLLREFDASLVCRYHNYAQDHYPCVEFKNGEILWWSHRLNIMDFDKS